MIKITKKKVRRFTDFRPSLLRNIVADYRLFGGLTLVVLNRDVLSLPVSAEKGGVGGPSMCHRKDWNDRASVRKYLSVRVDAVECLFGDVLPILAYEVL